MNDVEEKYLLLKKRYNALYLDHFYDKNRDDERILAIERLEDIIKSQKDTIVGIRADYKKNIAAMKQVINSNLDVNESLLKEIDTLKENAANKASLEERVLELENKMTIVTPMRKLW